MNRRTLKYVIAVSIGLIACQQAQECPTCVGKSMLEMKPFFKIHHPDRSSMEQAVSLQTTSTSTKQNDDAEQKLRKEEKA